MACRLQIRLAMARLITLTTTTTLVTLVAFALPATADPAGSAYTSTSAQAPGADDSSDDRAGRTESRWYGWQIGLVDLASYGLIGLAVQSNSDSPGPLVGIAGLSLALGGPMIHLVAHRPRQALTSLSLRTVVPLAGYFVSAFLHRNDECGSLRGNWLNCGARPARSAALAVFVAGQVVDFLLLGRYPPEPETKQPPGLTWHPVVSASPGGQASLGVAGTF